MNNKTVYVVRVLYRNKYDFDAYVRIFSTLKKAQTYFDEILKYTMEDYEITKENEHLNERRDDNYYYVAYKPGTMDYFEIYIKQEWVDLA